MEDLLSTLFSTSETTSDESTFLSDLDSFPIEPIPFENDLSSKEDNIKTISPTKKMSPPRKRYVIRKKKS